MKYPPKQNRSTCHCRVFINQKFMKTKFMNQKTNSSDVCSKPSQEGVMSRQPQWCCAELWPQDTISSTKLLNLSLYITPLHAIRELHAQHMKLQSIKEIPLCLKCKDAAFHSAASLQFFTAHCWAWRSLHLQHLKGRGSCFPQHPLGVHSQNMLLMLSLLPSWKWLLKNI